MTKHRTIVELYALSRRYMVFYAKRAALVVATLEGGAQVRGRFGLGRRLLSAAGTSLDLSGTCYGVGADELYLAPGEMPARIEISRHDDRVHILRAPVTN